MNRAEFATSRREFIMSHVLRTNSIALFAILVMLSTALRAQDQATDDDRSTLRIYQSNIPVRDLAQVLQQFVGDRDVTIVPELINNVLIVRASEEDLEQIEDVVQSLNRPTPRIALALTVFEVEGNVDIEDGEPAELLRTLSAGNFASQIRNIRLSSLEGQMAQVQLGEQRPIVSGTSFNRSGERFNSYQQQEFGTILSMTARVVEDRIVVELSYEMSRLDESIAATESAGDDVPPVRRTVTLRTTASVPEGEVVLLTDFDSHDSPGQTRLIGFLTATAE